MLLFLRRMSSAVEVLQIDENALRAELQGNGSSLLPQDVLVFSIDGPFFFGAVANLERTLAQTHADPRYHVIRLNRVLFMAIGRASGRARGCQYVWNGEVSGTIKKKK